MKSYFSSPCQIPAQTYDPIRVAPPPLRLQLEPFLPTRIPETDGCFEYGFQLRLPDGPTVDARDPLLLAFGAEVVWIDPDDEHEEALQDDVFGPGATLNLLPESFDPADPDAVGIWAQDESKQCGRLTARSAARVTAAGENGLAQRALVLSEARLAADDRRERIELLIYSPALVQVDPPARPAMPRPERVARPRLVLVADGTGELRWWDPSGSQGPIAAEELALSPELRKDLRDLRVALAGAAEQVEPEGHGFDRLEAEWERQELQDRSATVWRRARDEVGRRYAVGFLGAGMRRPVWSPSELEEDEDETGLFN